MNFAKPFLTSSEVHVWAVWLNTPTEISRAYRDLLVAEEIVRAERFAFENLRRHYEVSQGALRLLLARYLKRLPRELIFTFGPRGKPALADDVHLQFNLSNSGEMSLYALTTNCEIGVDVEQVRPLIDLSDLASRYFCDAEAAELSSIDDERFRLEAFYRCWTRKEAYIKAIGTGLYHPLDQFQVTLLANDPARFVHIGGSAKTADGWTLQHLDPAPDYIGALAYQGAPRKIIFHPPLTPHELMRIGE